MIMTAVKKNALKIQVTGRHSILHNFERSMTEWHGARPENYAVMLEGIWCLYTVNQNKNLSQHSFCQTLREVRRPVTKWGGLCASQHPHKLTNALNLYWQLTNSRIFNWQVILRPTPKFSFSNLFPKLRQQFLLNFLNGRNDVSSIRLCNGHGFIMSNVGEIVFQSEEYLNQFNAWNTWIHYLERQTLCETSELKIMYTFLRIGS